MPWGGSAVVQAGEEGGLDEGSGRGVEERDRGGLQKGGRGREGPDLWVVKPAPEEVGTRGGRGGHRAEEEVHLVAAEGGSPIVYPGGDARSG